MMLEGEMSVVFTAVNAGDVSLFSKDIHCRGCLSQIHCRALLDIQCRKLVSR